MGLRESDGGVLSVRGNIEYARSCNSVVCREVEREGKIEMWLIFSKGKSIIDDKLLLPISYNTVKFIFSVHQLQVLPDPFLTISSL